MQLYVIFKEDLSDFLCNILFRKGVLTVDVDPNFNGFMIDCIQDGVFLCHVLYPCYKIKILNSPQPG